MAIGRPIELTPNVATKNISSIATADQTSFTVTGGYRINEIAVYRNGVRLADGRDFTASDGSTVNLVTGCVVDDIIEFAVFDSFDVAGTIVSAASSQNLDGDLNVTGNLYAGTFNPTNITGTAGTITRITNTNLVATAGTFNSVFHVGSALTANAAGDVETIGIITAASFSGDGTGLSGVVGVGTLNVRTESLTVSGVSTFTGALNATSVVSSGAVSGTTGTFSAAVSGTTGTFSGAVNVDATTDSTSTSTGALIVDGGLGVAKNVYIGAGLSVAGTLTYEDVTSVDSVGLITAKSGVNITGGELTVGSGITMGIAGVATFSGTSDVHLLDSVRLNVGDGSDLAIYHNGSHSFLENGTGALVLKGSDVNIQSTGGVKSLYAYGSGIELNYSGNKKFETTNDGTVTTGIATATAGLEINADNKYLKIGAGGDLQMMHNGTNSLLINTTGDLVLQSDSIKLRSTSGEAFLQATLDGAVDLRYNDSLKFATTNDGTVTTGIGTFTSDIKLTAAEGKLEATGATGLTLNASGGSAFARIRTAGTESLRVDSSQKILKGHTTASGDLQGPQTTNGRSPGIQIHGSTAPDAGASLISWSASSGSYYSPTIWLARSGSGTKGTNTIIPASNAFGSIVFSGDDGTDFVKGAMIVGDLDGTPGSDDMPGRLEFYTTADGADSPTERLRITSTGDLNLGATGTYNDITGTGGGLLIGPGTGKNAGIVLRSDSDGFGRIYFGDNSGSAAQRHDGYIVYSQTDRNFVVGTATTTRIAVGSAGQIGIAGANYGSSGQVLTSGGSGSAPSWADAGGGAWEVVSTTVLSGSTSDLQLYGWSNSYAQYKVVFNDCYHSSSTVMRIRWYVDSTSGNNGTLNTSNQYKSTNIRNEYASNGSNSFGGGGQFGAGYDYMLPAHVNSTPTAQTMWSGELIFPMKTTSYSIANKCYGSILGTSYLYAPIGCKLDDDESKFLTGIHIYWVDNSGSPGARSPSTGRVTLLRMKYS